MATSVEGQGNSMKEKSLEEANKLFYDAFKHLTTLSTGAILILASLLETLFSKPHWKFMMVLALVGFIVATVGAVRMMFFQASAVMESKVETTAGEQTAFLVTAASFLLGIISFVVFAIRNFFG